MPPAPAPSLLTPISSHPQRFEKRQRCSYEGTQAGFTTNKPHLIVPVVTADNLTLQKGIVYDFHLISFLYQRSTVRAMIHTKRAARIVRNSNHFEGNGLLVACIK